MSHFSKIKTQLSDQAALLAALADLGFGKDKVQVYELDTPAHLYGYRGDRREQTAHIIIRRNFVGAASNDIGFARQEDGSFEALISEYDEHSMGYDQKWLARLTQRYSYHLVLKRAEAIGFEMVEITTERGELHLTFARPKLTHTSMSGF